MGGLAILKGPSGDCYNVQLKRSEGRIYLQQGWRKFVKDNVLGDGEFLIFKYNGNLSFEVQIFDKTGVERRVRSGSAATNPVMIGDSRHEYFTSTNPYTKVCLRKGAAGHPHILNLPTEFCRKYLPPFKIKLTLKNLEGKVWEVNSIYATKKHSFCKGWADFVHDNNLKQDDIFILELVADNEMIVHIFHQ